MEDLDYALRDVSLDQSKWPVLMRALEAYMGCSDLHLVSINVQTQDLLQNFPLNAVEAVDEFADIVDICEPAKYAASNPNWGVIKDQDFISEKDIRKSDFYAWVTKYDATYRLGLRLLREADADAHIWFLKARSQGPVTADDVQKLERIAPQLRLAAQVGHALAGSAIHLDRLVESLGAAFTASIVLDGRGAVAYANDRANAVLRRGDGLCYVKRSIVLSDGRVQRQFDRLVANAARASLSSDLQRPGGRLAVPRPSGLPPYQIIVSSLPPTDPFLDESKPWVLALIIDPLAVDAPTTDFLQQGFHLTPMEADVAARFATGSTLATIAEERGVTLGTMRVQFKTVMAKMGVRRQVELMRLLTLLAHPSTIGG